MSYLDEDDAVTLRWRKDGWTPERQAAFLDELAESGSVGCAAASVGMSASSAYRLRAHDDGSAFRAAWREAESVAWHRVRDLIMDRCENGTRHAVRYRGEIVGERRAYSDRCSCSCSTGCARPRWRPRYWRRVKPPRRPSATARCARD